MEKTNNIIGVIPARRGSKRFPGKNQHLFYYTLQAVKESKLLNHVIVSSDDPLLLEIAHWSLDCITRPRPERLAMDHSSQYEVIIDLLQAGHLPLDSIIVLLQLTSPLRSAQDIDDAIRYFLSGQMQSLVSVSKVHEEPSCIIDQEGNFVVSQLGSGPYYFINGAIYINYVSFLMDYKSFYVPGKTQHYLMPKYRSIDVDDREDFEMATLIMGGQQNGKQDSL